MNRERPDPPATHDTGRRAMLRSDDRAERRMPLKGLLVALGVIAVGWARARWWT